MKKLIKTICSLILPFLCVAAITVFYVTSLKDRNEVPLPEPVVVEEENKPPTLTDYGLNEPTVTLETGTTATDGAGAEDFKLIVLDVGQASCAIIESGGETMIFDGGDRETSSFVVSYCKLHGYNHFQYMVASHYDSDHIAGLVGILKTSLVDKILLPDYTADSRTYQSFMECTAFHDCTHPSVGETFQMGEITFTVICAGKGPYTDENSYSIGLIGQCDGLRFLIDGDATAVSEEEMLESGIDLSSDLLIVPHHGSNTSNSLAWLEAVSPKTAIISCGRNKGYYHPHKVVLDNLKSVGIRELYRTDENGTVSVTIRDHCFVVETERTSDEQRLWTPGED